MEYLGIEKTAGVDSGLMDLAIKPGIVPIGGAKAFPRLESPINSSSPLKA